MATSSPSAFSTTLTDVTGPCKREYLRRPETPGIARFSGLFTADYQPPGQVETSTRQLAEAVGVSEAWIHHRIRTGRITVTRGSKYKLHLFPDKPATIDALRQLVRGELRHIDLSTHPRD